MSFFDTSGQQGGRLEAIPPEFERRIDEDSLLSLTAQQKRWRHRCSQAQQRARLRRLKRDPHGGIRSWAEAHKIPLE